MTGERTRQLGWEDMRWAEMAWHGMAWRVPPTRCSEKRMSPAYGSPPRDYYCRLRGRDYYSALLTCRDPGTLEEPRNEILKTSLFAVVDNRGDDWTEQSYWRGCF